MKMAYFSLSYHINPDSVRQFLPKLGGEECFKNRTFSYVSVNSKRYHPPPGQSGAFDHTNFPGGRDLTGARK